MGYPSIQRYSLSSSTEVVGLRGGSDAGRLIFRFTEDTRMAMSEGELDFNFFTYPAGTMLVLDPPNLLSGTDLFVRLDSASSGVVELLRC